MRFFTLFVDWNSYAVCLAKNIQCNRKRVYENICSAALGKSVRKSVLSAIRLQNIYIRCIYLIAGEGIPHSPDFCCHALVAVAWRNNCTQLHQSKRSATIYWNHFIRLYFFPSSFISCYFDGIQSVGGFFLLHILLTYIFYSVSWKHFIIIAEIVLRANRNVETI